MSERVNNVSIIYFIGKAGELKLGCLLSLTVVFLKLGIESIIVLLESP